MTLCIAAICQERDAPRIVTCADNRSEVGWASGDVSFKFRSPMHSWGALIAGDESKADDLLDTCALVWPLDLPKSGMDMFDRFNNVASAHKAKLCDRYVRQKLGISFERFLTKGSQELTPETRNQVFHELSEIDFACDVIFFRVAHETFLFTMDKDGTVERYRNFTSIGTGSLIAESTLFQRGQDSHYPVERTLYNCYEATRLAVGAPGVGPTKDFLVFAPPPSESIELTVIGITDKCLQVLDRKFNEVGPKDLVKAPVLGPECFSKDPDPSE